MSVVDINHLAEIASVEYKDIVIDTSSEELNYLRIVLVDGSFIDVWFSLKNKGRYSYHWERKAIDRSIFRHNNAPHLRWKSIKTFPKHSHNGNEEEVIESHISDEPEEALRGFLDFCRMRLIKLQ